MYYIIENQHRPDGIINNEITSRENINSALSYFHDRFSKMAMTTLYKSVALSCLDENLNEIEHKIVKTMWVEPQPEPDTEEPSEEAEAE